MASEGQSGEVREPSVSKAKAQEHPQQQRIQNNPKVLRRIFNQIRNRGANPDDSLKAITGTIPEHIRFNASGEIIDPNEPVEEESAIVKRVKGISAMVRYGLRRVGEGALTANRQEDIRNLPHKLASLKEQLDRAKPVNVEELIKQQNLPPETQEPPKK